MEDAKKNEQTGVAELDDITGGTVPYAAAGRIKRFERIGMLRDALLPKAMKGDVRSVATIFECDDREEKIVENFEQKRTSDSIAIAYGRKPDGTVVGQIYYTPGECAAILGVTPKTIRNAILRGELEASLTPGGHHRIRREEMGRYMTSNIEKIVENSEKSNESEKSEESNATTVG